ncbi:4'-phosphopantetheinyl transferase [Fictibacillus macauensis ZFHKF-1]|uniref:Holo-[acyl-carrier-protein] synthase n=1 Tax=Fictibacillus macauensis ZFHKF-1 TaxID=1196324 RepID=I8J6H6_9BACL|nr:holo-ACP synthase [Fictibacillus macauensis]EIT87421.1 4'-phosphopantetheinyl transferase [Fictibacillus macauensis ZFHKF-1]
MIVGLGLDVVELSRVEKVLQRQPRFAERILTSLEMETYNGYSGKRKIEFLAGRFAAKEAYAKAKGTGIGKDLSWHDIEIIRHSSGKPMIAQPEEGMCVHVSITHTRELAAAQVIFEEMT